MALERIRRFVCIGLDRTAVPTQFRDGTLVVRVMTPRSFLPSPLASLGSRRTMIAVVSTGRTALLAFAALALLTAIVGCFSDNSASHNAATKQNTSAPVVVAAGDIASCYGTGDEATSKVLSNTGDTVLTLGDNAYDDRAPGEFADCYRRRTPLLARIIRE